MHLLRPLFTELWIPLSPYFGVTRRFAKSPPEPFPTQKPTIPPRDSVRAPTVNVGVGVSSTKARIV